MSRSKVPLPPELPQMGFLFEAPAEPPFDPAAAVIASEAFQKRWKALQNVAESHRGHYFSDRSLPSVMKGDPSTNKDGWTAFQFCLQCSMVICLCEGTIMPWEQSRRADMHQCPVLESKLLRSARLVVTGRLNNFPKAVEYAAVRIDQEHVRLWLYNEMTTMKASKTTLDRLFTAAKKPGKFPEKWIFTETLHKNLRGGCIHVEQLAAGKAFDASWRALREAESLR